MWQVQELEQREQRDLGEQVGAGGTQGECVEVFLLTWREERTQCQGPTPSPLQSNAKEACFACNANVAAAAAP